MGDDFRIRLCSDLDYEGMVVDVCWGNDTVAMLTHEDASSAIQITILFSPDAPSTWKFPLDKFVETIQAAKKIFLEINEKQQT